MRQGQQRPGSCVLPGAFHGRRAGAGNVPWQWEQQVFSSCPSRYSWSNITGRGIGENRNFQLSKHLQVCWYQEGVCLKYLHLSWATKGRDRRWNLPWVTETFSADNLCIASCINPLKTALCALSTNLGKGCSRERYKIRRSIAVLTKRRSDPS